MVAYVGSASRRTVPSAVQRSQTWVPPGDPGQADRRLDRRRADGGGPRWQLGRQAGRHTAQQSGQTGQLGDPAAQPGSRTGGPRTPDGHAG